MSAPWAWRHTVAARLAQTLGRTQKPLARQVRGRSMHGANSQLRRVHRATPVRKRAAPARAAGGLWLLRIEPAVWSGWSRQVLRVREWLLVATVLRVLQWSKLQRRGVCLRVGHHSWSLKQSMQRCAKLLRSPKTRSTATAQHLARTLRHRQNQRHKNQGPPQPFTSAP